MSESSWSNGTAPVMRKVRGAFLAAVFFFGANLFTAAIPAAWAQDNSQEAQKTPPTLGTVKSVSGNTVVMTTDAGSDVNVAVKDSTRIVRVIPGMKDLKDAQSVALKDLQAGDRVAVRGAASGSGVSATAIYVMTKSDVADQHAKERARWNTGVAGLVSSVDVAGRAVHLNVVTLQGKKDVTVHVTDKTTLRRYAPGSVKFDEAKAAPLTEIRAGDQLRARGDKNADGTELTAVEVVSGSFRNISGEISAVDTAQNTITVRDLTTKKNVTVKFNSDAQLRKLPTALAQRIAVRLKGGTETTAASGAAGGTPDAGGAPGAGGAPAGGAGANGDARPRRGFGAGGGTGGPGGGGPPDFSQIISRQPTVALADLHKDDAVILVGTESSGSEVTAITLLAGVEPILQGSPNGASSILSPWSLSGAPSGE
jgi:hypothetical protein